MADWYISPVSTLFPSVRWSTGSQEVWLTFDDGPHPVATDAVLEVLRDETTPAVFFLLGHRAERHPDIVRSIRDAGHVIGSHGHDHQPVWSMGRKELSENLRRANDALIAAGAPKPRLYRPTYGRFRPDTLRVVRDSGLDMVMFSVNSWDFSEAGSTRVIERTVRRTRAGDILLFHDNAATASSIASAVREVIKRLRAAGMKFGIPGPL
jgi:peptidoglycan/xylan/chitin deacetylase (PgdA/CDA1 family)